SVRSDSKTDRSLTLLSDWHSDPSRPRLTEGVGNISPEGLVAQPGQSSGLIIRRLQVQILPGPPPLLSQRTHGHDWLLVRVLPGPPPLLSQRTHGHDWLLVRVLPGPPPLLSQRTHGHDWLLVRVLPGPLRRRIPVH